MDRLEEIKNDSNWEAAFSYADDGQVDTGTCGCSAPTAAVPGDDINCAPAKLTDVKRVIAAWDGAHDEERWLGVFELEDGRFLMVTAGCDYTGWG